MKFNKKHGLPGYGNIGKTGDIGKTGLSTYYIDYNLKNLNDLQIFYNKLLNSSENYNQYDYIIDNKTFVYFVKDILNTNGTSIPNDLFSFNLNSFYNYYLDNRIYSNYYVDNVYTNDYYVKGNYINYNNYVYNKNLNHVIYNNKSLLNTKYILPYNLYLNKDFNTYYSNVKNNNYSYNLISSNKLIFNNLELIYNSNKDMTLNINNNYYPVISLCDMPIKNLLPSNFNLVNSNLIDISTCITNIKMVDNNIEFDWNVNNIFKSFNSNLINEYKFYVIIYTDPKYIITSNALEFDADNNRLTCDNQYFTYKSKRILLKDYLDNNLSGKIKITNNYFDSSLINNDINYKFVLQIYSKYEKSLNNYIEYSIYSNSIIKNKLGPNIYFIDVDQPDINMPANEQKLILNITTNIPYETDEIGINIINNANWITIDNIEKLSLTQYKVTCTCASNIDNITYENTYTRSTQLKIVSKNISFNEYYGICNITQDGYSSTLNRVDYQIFDNDDNYETLINDNSIGLFCDMFAKYISLPIFNANNETWLSLGGKYIELDLDLVIEFIKNKLDENLSDFKNNSFRIGVQYIGKNKNHDNYCKYSIDDIVADTSIQDLYNVNGISKYIKPEFSSYINVLESDSYNYSDKEFQYLKYKWINFDKNRNNDNTSPDSVVELNTDYFINDSSTVICRLESSNDDNIVNETSQVLKQKIIIPIEDGLTLDESNDIINATINNNIILNYKKYIEYSPKIRIFFQYENPSVSSIQISYKRNSIRILNESFEEISNSYANNSYNDSFTNSKLINIVDWHPVLTSGIFNNSTYPYIQFRSNYIDYGFNENGLNDYFTNDKNSYKISIKGIRNLNLPYDYSKYNYPVNNLPTVISNISYIKYGFNNQSSYQNTIIEGTEVLSSKYKQVNNNYPVFGVMDYNMLYSDIIMGNNKKIINAPQASNNNYIPDNIYETWYNQLTFGSWSVVNIHSNSRFIVNHEMTTNRNLDMIYTTDPSVLLYLPELNSGLFMNNLYNLGSPNGKIITLQISKYACPYNLFFDFSILTYYNEKINNSIIYHDNQYYINLIGRPQVGTYTEYAAYVYLNADSGQNYISNAPLANYNAPNNNFWQTYTIPDR